MKKTYAKPELSQIVNVDAANPKNPILEFEVFTDVRQRAALAKRFDLVGIESLQATVQIESKQSGAWIDVLGHIDAVLQQFCVVSGEPCDAVVDENFFTEYKRADVIGGEEDDAELLEGNMLDIGEIVAQYFFLALEPFPRKAKLKEPNVDVETHRPFAALKALSKDIKE